MADQMPELMVGLEFLRTLHNAGFEGPPAVLLAPPPVAPFVCSFHPAPCTFAGVHRTLVPAPLCGVPVPALPPPGRPPPLT